jgi:hypothetical protein
MVSTITTIPITTTTIISTNQKQTPITNGRRIMMGAMGIVSFLIIVVLVLAAAAHVKYLFSSR